MCMSSPAVSIFAVRDALLAIPERLKGVGDGLWTTEIKRVMIELGQKNGWRVWTSYQGEPRPDSEEWLYDLCWAEQQQLDKRQVFTKLGLALESEWGREAAIIDDFWKLLCCRATIKVMVWQGCPGLVSHLVENIAIWNDPPGTYLLADYDSATGAFLTRVI